MSEQEWELLSAFLAGLRGIRWLSASGTASAHAYVVNDAAEGFDDPVREGLWDTHARDLEVAAIDRLGERGLDDVFRETASTIDEALASALEAWFERRPVVNEATDANVDLGLWPEILESIKRDVAWAAIEAVLAAPGFFSGLMGHYRDGRWPCSWRGTFPDGQVVVL